MPILLFLGIIGALIYFSNKHDKTLAESVKARYGGKRLDPREKQTDELARVPNPLDSVREGDPNFSEPAFKAFSHLLFTRFHEAKGGCAESLRGYVDGSLLEALLQATPASQVVVGASRYAFADEVSGEQALSVEFEACFEANGIDLYCEERWVFARRKGILSKDPEALLGLACPNCGNSGELSPQGVCPFCEATVNSGTFNWRVIRREVLKEIPRPPLELQPGGGEEVGTDLKTAYQPDFAAQKRAFLGRHPEFVWSDFEQRVTQIFLNLQSAWSRLDFQSARAYETDPLYDTHRFWIERYRQQGLTNRLEDISVLDVEPCRFSRDGYYDTITVRIFASMKDFTVDAAGQVVSGDPKQQRKFSEYWTMLKRIDAKSGPARNDLSSCPNCGAAVQVSQAGICQHCNAKVTSGNYDWTLSSIEQDESVTGQW